MPDNIIELLKVIFLGIVEGVTEWLPISSTGHMLLVDEFLRIDMTEAFKEMFFVVIQLGAILAVVTIFFKKMWPFHMKDKKPSVKKDTMLLWVKVVVACIPGAVVTLLFDDWIEKSSHTRGDRRRADFLWHRVHTDRTLEQEPYDPDRKGHGHHVLYRSDDRTFSGAFDRARDFQIRRDDRRSLADRRFARRGGGIFILPRRSGHVRMERFKLLKFGFDFTGAEIVTLLVGMLVAFVVSLLVIKFLMNYIKKHDFKLFGWYRIALGIIVILYFALSERIF